MPRGDGTVSNISGQDGMEANHWWNSIYTNQLCNGSVCTLVLHSSGRVNRDHRSSVDRPNRIKDSKEQRTQGVKAMELSTSEILGTLFYSLCVFGLGALSGKRIWNWARSYFPWNRK